MTTELVNPYQSLIISYFLSDFAPASIEKAKHSFLDSKKIAYLEVSSIEDASIKLRNHGRGILLYGLSQKGSIQEISQFLDANRKEIESGFIRVLVFDKFMSERIHRKLTNLGCSEILNAMILEKAFLYKIVLNIQLLEKKWITVQTPSVQKSTYSVSEHDFKINEPSFITQKIDPIWVDAMSIESDCWIIEDSKQVKCVGDRWIIECIGPGPATGKWIHVKFKSLYGDNAWEWKPTDPENNFFVNKAGRWLYFGKEPKFHWDIKQWRFTDEKPILAYFYDEHTCLYRFHVDSNQRLIVCKNSANALKLKADIEKTLHQFDQFNNELINSFKDEDIDWDDSRDVEQILQSNEELEINIPGLVSGDKVFQCTGLDIQIWKEEGKWKSNESIMIEHDIDKIILDSPINGLRIGDQLRAQIKTIALNPPLVCEIKTVIKNIQTQSSEDVRGLLTLEVVPSYVAELQNIFDSYNTRQTEVFNLFKEIRGY